MTSIVLPVLTLWNVNKYEIPVSGSYPLPIPLELSVARSLGQASDERRRGVRLIPLVGLERSMGCSGS